MVQRVTRQFLYAPTPHVEMLQSVFVEPRKGIILQPQEQSCHDHILKTVIIAI